MTQQKITETKEILSIISTLKNKLARDLNKNSQTIKMFELIKKLEHSVYKIDRFIDVNMQEKAYTEAAEVKKILDLILQAAEENPDPEDVTKFRKRPASHQYVWKTEPGACKKCEALDGTEYESIEDVPKKVHPNCKCTSEEIETPVNENVFPKRLPRKRPGGQYPDGKLPKKPPAQQPDGKDDVIIIDDDYEIPKKVLNLMFPEVMLILFLFKQLLKEMQKSKYALPAAYWYKFYKNTSENKSQDFAKLYQVRDFEMRDFIKKKYKVNNFSPVFIPNDEDSIYDYIEKSPEMQVFIETYYEAIKSGKYANSSISFAFTSFSLKNTIHKCEIYKPHIDAEGNLNFTIIDLYDFALIKDYGNGINKLISLLNNYSYYLQIRGYNGSYVIIIPVRINRDKLKND